MKAIKVENVKKSFGKLQVLKGIDLVVQQGEIFTLLGENGAGKSTLINILATLSQADEGIIEVKGFRVGENDNKIRQKISLNAQTSTLDEEFTGYENLKLILELRGVKNVRDEINQIAERLDLTDFIQRKVRAYSGGMRRRLDLAMSLVGNPEIIFLDEPTTGVDPKSRLELWQMIEQMRALGKTIFLTTQYLEEADRLSDHIAFIHDGRIVRYGTPQELKRVTKVTYTIEVDPADINQAKDILTSNEVNFTSKNAKITINKVNVNRALTALLAENIQVLHYNLDETDLETVFLTMTDEVEV